MEKIAKQNLLRNTRVYLSGPMDFVASREVEKKFGWRNRVSEFLQELGVTVFDPWFKPEIQGVKEYGREDETTAKVRAQWSFDPSEKGANARASCADHFWPALHMDLRMVDTSDFIVAYVPTNVYSVGTPHEIILCRSERKPVLFVSPPVKFPALDRLRDHLSKKGDSEGSRMLKDLEVQIPIKENPDGSPSLWYMPLIGGEHFFDGFGFLAHGSSDRRKADWSSLEFFNDRTEDAIIHIVQSIFVNIQRFQGKLSNRFGDRAIAFDLRKVAGTFQ